MDTEETEIMMIRKRNAFLAGIAVLATAGLGAGVALAATGSSGKSPAPAAAPASPATYTAPSYSWYQSMMTGYYGTGTGTSMMGGTSSGSYGWMMSPAGYQWMTGHGTASPGWMAGGTLPSAMMSTRGMMGDGTDPGKVMGTLYANAPGPRVSAAQATALGGQAPVGAQVSKAANTITFTTTTVHLAIIASPSGGPDETFRVAGLVNPRIIVPAGARVTIQLVNADPDTAHGLVITASSATNSWMPMMTDRPAFTGAALWFLGNPTSAGMHAGTLTFTAAALGTYHYLCPVPGHAQKGMTGTIVVR
jgi:rusticyanin